MSHTPEQAKELWCPMVRLAGCLPNGEVQPGQTVVNRLQINLNSGAEIPSSSKCLAEKCSMWRWEPSKTTHAERRVIDMSQYGTGFNPGMQFVETTVQVPDAPTHGYCGISGRPEATL